MSIEKLCLVGKSTVFACFSTYMYHLNIDETYTEKNIGVFGVIYTEWCNEFRVQKYIRASYIRVVSDISTLRNPTISPSIPM